MEGGGGGGGGGGREGGREGKLQRTSCLGPVGRQSKVPTGFGV